MAEGQKNLSKRNFPLASGLLEITNYAIFGETFSDCQWKERDAMGKTSNAVVWLVMGVILLCGTAYADTGMFAVAPKVSTLGLGGDLAVKITPGVNCRLGLQGFSYDFDATESDIEYDFDVDMFSSSALLDWHIFGDAFHITGGFLFADMDFDLDAKPADTLTIGDNDYDADDVGSLTGTLDIDDVVPYVGIGWGNPFDKKKRAGFIIDLGVAYTGAPDIALSATGPAAGTPQFQEDLKREEQDLKDETSDYKFYPVISLSFYYRF
jgi:hypothetical protein